jgi:hypothetical protein
VALLERRAGPGEIEPSGHSPQRTAYFANGPLIADSILVAETVLRLLPRFHVQTSQGEFVSCGSSMSDISHIQPSAAPKFRATATSNTNCGVDRWGYMRNNSDGVRDND